MTSGSAAGADALRRRTASWLRGLGMRGRGAVGDRPATGWDSFTDAERRVVDEVAKGLTYREVGERLHISRRTVETHVANALRKLGLRNRSQLATAHARRAASLTLPSPSSTTDPSGRGARVLTPR